MIIYSADNEIECDYNDEGESCKASQEVKYTYSVYIEEWSKLGTALATRNGIIAASGGGVGKWHWYTIKCMRIAYTKQYGGGNS